MHSRNKNTYLLTNIDRTRLPSNLRPTARDCVHYLGLVTSGHVTKMAVTPFDRHAKTSRFYVLENRSRPDADESVTKLFSTFFAPVT